MGQQASSAEQAVATSSRPGGFCCGAPQDQPARSKDTVVVQLEADDSLGASEAAPEAAIQRKRPKRPEGGFFRCGLSTTSAPEVEVSNIRSRRASVGWTSPTGKPPRKFHIDVLRLPAAAGGASRKAEQGLEVAFFEADGADNSFELPEGTLERASGLYRIEVVVESGTLDRPLLSHPGCSAMFSTPAEPPGLVSNLALAEAPCEHEFRVCWGPPADDGGSIVEDYEVMLKEPSSAGAEGDAPPVLESEETPLLGEEAAPHTASSEEAEETLEIWGLSSAASSPAAANAAAAGEERVVQCFRTKELSHGFSGLPAGSGPYHVEVRACSAASLLGDAAMLCVSTAVAAPKVPTGLRARLLPAWPYIGEGGPGTPRGSLEDLGASDVDIVRLEFRAPVEDGGRPLESYLIYTAEECEDELAKEDLVSLAAKQPSARKPGSAPVCAVAASDAAGPGQMAPGCACACDVAVEPNRAYTFSVEASNGALRSGPCEPAPSVFVPARVPLPPRGPPEVFRVEGGFVAELRWLGPINAGGLPLLSFKIGVLGPVTDTDASSMQDSVGMGDVQREVTVTCASALAAAAAGRGGINWTPPAQAGPNEALYGARVEGLQASAKYCFVLASSNAVGTGRWSKPSSPVWTPVAAPATPMSPVATVTVDKNQRVMVTVTWECGLNQAGSGSTAAFHVTLSPAQSSATTRAPEQKRERVVATGCHPGRRVSWASELSHPGHYVVEVVAESSAGQRSPPAVLSLDVRPEAFPTGHDAAPDAPHWAEEPVLVLGPTSESEAQFGDFDPGTWLQALLLWHDSDPNPFSAKAKERTVGGSLASPADVVCCFRKPGSSDAHRTTLATGITSSRLQVALPAHVPMSLRLVVRNEQSGSSPSDKHARKERPAAKVQSEPLLLLMSEGSEHLKAVWEVWSRNSPDGQPPRWRELPEMLQTVLEAHWLEGHPRVAFEIQPGMDNDACPLASARYELTFGDERQVQHSVRRVSQPSWTSKVRRSVRDGEGEDAAAPTMAADDQCVVCMERRRTHAFMHSDTGDGHLAVCGACAEAYKAEVAAGGAARSVRNCPMCRRPFTAVQRIYQ